MADYKSAKEAFHADNPGSSVHYINLISVTALTGYALYATASRRTQSWLLDYTTTVLPLLLAMTTMSSHLVLLNGVLVVAAFVFKATTPKSWYPHRVTKPRGRWLADSDSEDEGGSGRRTPTRRPKVKLPSQMVAEANAAEAERQSGSASASALSSPVSPDEGRRRRVSPVPWDRGAVIDIGSLKAPLSSSPGKLDPPPTQTQLPDSGPRRPLRPRTYLPFLSVYRSHMMVMTVLAILAVDFPVFPRILGKTEDWGTGLMDVGVGSFVFSLGIVSSKAFSATRKDKAFPATRRNKMLATLLGSLRRALPVLALGFVRLLMVKGVEYPEHVTEYGVHWNFFFTLGLVPALATALLPLRRKYKWGVIAVAIAVLQQLIFAVPGLTPFLLNSHRPNILAANKEGLASLAGYLAIFLVGLGIGEHILMLSTGRRRRHSSLRRREPVTSGNESDDEFSDPDVVAERATRRRPELALELAGYAAASWFALGACNYFGWRVSRRLANVPYVLWTVAYNASYLAGYLFIEIWLSDPRPGHYSRACPPLLDAVNANGLAVFLLANVGTGIINVSMQTMFAPDWLAMAVLVLYSVAVCGIAWLLRGVRIKI
ncbi:hypothetical protein CspeluHIS016_0113440 [Cutaneotrichosporon spelunceum]|uniref:GPI-anchored wall transfer protein n=1 Tax=Cutaneotrichosporon spelunceum TaxID=1672016 RepID=A0AAD3YA77_9TREE|nr:hypothetical protein CspeluHIS016_0113440 [Cutaneotrichosporon spelunceum]